jgi:hypothetical protein
VKSAPVDDPRWARDAGAADDPLAVYADTYSAISGMPAERRPRRRRARHRVVSLLVVAAAAAVGAGWWTGMLSLPDFAPTTETAPPLPVPRSAYAPDVIGTTPARPKATIRVGEERQFAVAATGPDLRYGWTIDGAPAGTGPSWTYVPGRGDVGRRRVEVAVAARDGTERRAWAVRVRSARPPDLVLAEPASPNIEVETPKAVQLRVRAEPRPSEHLRTMWQVDGSAAGEGETLTLRADRPGTRVVRAIVQSDLGTATRLEWRVNALAPEPPVDVASVRPPAPPAVPAAPEREAEPPPATAAPEREAEPSPASKAVQHANEPEPAPAIAAPAPPPARAVPAEPPPRRRAAMADPAATAGVRLASRTPERTSEEEVRLWLERYAEAWRAHDVDALRRMGQVTTDAEVDALRSYFQTVRDLDVELNVIALRAEGDQITVRFTRRDRFRDPAGRLVLKESPTLEKQIVRTPAGLRFVRPTG